MIPDEPALDLGSGDVEDMQVVGNVFFFLFRIFMMMLWGLCI